MLFENIRVHPIELHNNLTGQNKILLPGEIMDLPEALGKMYFNYLKPVITEAVETELFVEDIQTEIVSEFNMTSDLVHKDSLKQLDLFTQDSSKEDGLFEEKEDVKTVEKKDENILVVEEEKKEKGKKGRPKVYENVSAAEKRKLQRQKKKETEAKFKDLKF